MKDNLPEGWRKIRLGEIAEFNLNNYTSKDNWRYVNYLDTGNLTSNLIGDIFFLDLETNKLPSRAKRKVKKNDILYSTVRPNQKHIGIITEPLKNMLVSTGFAVMTVNLNEANPYYIYSYLDQVKVTNHLQAIAEQRVSTYPALNIADLQTLPISLPPLPEQEAIASTLSVLDDKIELNNKINENLEAQAQALFKHWFVDFEFPDENGKPYKSSGGVMVKSELGMIPERWAVHRLDEVANITMGQSPKGTSYNENGEGMDFYQGRTDFSERFPRRRLYTTEPNKIAKKGDILMSVRAPVGDINIANEDCCIGRGLSALNSTNNLNSFLLYTMKQLKDKYEFFNAEGTVFGSITQRDLKAMQIIKPSVDLMQKYDGFVLYLDEMYLSLDTETRVLEKLRDVLLPVLMSSELRLSNIDNGV